MPPKTRRLKPELRWAFLAAAVVFAIWGTYSLSHPGRKSSTALGSAVKLGQQQASSDGGDGSGSSGVARKLGAGEQGSATSLQAQPCPTQSPSKEVVKEVVKAQDPPKDNPRAYHLVTTTQGFANHWQARIHYYWWRKHRETCLKTMSPCDMGGFTRLLHSGEADDLMDEMPTVVVDPLPKDKSGGSYVVLNRPFAFMTWLKKVSIPEKYVLMGEADHLFMRPMPNLMNGESQGAAIFTYITPSQYGKVVRKFIGDVSDEEVKRVPQIGNSPTIASVEELRVLVPEWYNTTMAIFNDQEAHKAWNWVLEMYGYALATYRTNQHRNLRVYTNMLAHPPFDKKMTDYLGQPFYIVHLTYPCGYDEKGNFTDRMQDTVWKFDKRQYMETPPPRELQPPPKNVRNLLVREIISMVNEATAAIPCWDDYYRTQKVTTKCSQAQELDAANTVRR